jgi:hypothetical protein
MKLSKLKVLNWVTLNLWIDMPNQPLGLEYLPRSTMKKIHRNIISKTN